MAKVLLSKISGKLSLQKFQPSGVAPFLEEEKQAAVPRRKGLDLPMVESPAPSQGLQPNLSSSQIQGRFRQIVFSKKSEIRTGLSVPWKHPRLRSVVQRVLLAREHLQERFKPRRSSSFP